jgi:LacI family transcriptional regulator/LacI family repressor for deo operon, udp, cdd, tsx, nupC, and nupG
MRLEDVARVAGVSASTVSRVITRPEMVSAATRDRVNEAIAELGYRPSRVARRLRVETGRSSLIGLVIPDIQNPFFADLVRGVEDAAREQGYAVFLGNSDEDVEKEARYLEIMRAESVDGVILPPASRSVAPIRGLLDEGIPVVCVDRRLDRPIVDTVVIDNERGARDAVAHLLRLGHRRIGFIQGLPVLSTSEERLAGYRQALAGAGIEPDPALVREGDSRQGGGRRFIAELLRESDPPSAVVVGNSLMTLGALEGIRRLGLRIPDDIALIGYDDMPWALAMDPPLTVVRQPAQEIGRRAMDTLLARFADPDREPGLVMLQSELVVRGSCGGQREMKDAAGADLALRPETAAVGLDDAFGDREAEPGS